jgi:hypothetical protein
MDCGKCRSDEVSQQPECSRACVIQASAEGFPIKEWDTTIKSEYDSLVSRKTWTLVPCHGGRKLVDSKWVLKLKRDANGDGGAAAAAPEGVRSQARRHPLTSPWWAMETV